MTAAENSPSASDGMGSASIAPALTPEERLARSRAKLRAWYEETYREENPEHSAAKQHGRDEEEGDPSWLGAIFDVLADVPAATVAARWLRRWWARHPLRSTADLASAITREVAGPLSKRHPWLLLGGAALAGMLISRLRPWRWISGGAILASLVPRVDLNTLLHWFSVAMQDIGAQRPTRDSAAETEPDVAPTADASAQFTQAPPSSNLH